jgi:hypothetical protein
LKQEAKTRTSRFQIVAARPKFSPIPRFALIVNVTALFRLSKRSEKIKIIVDNPAFFYKFLIMKTRFGSPRKLTSGKGHFSPSTSQRPAWRIAQYGEGPFDLAACVTSTPQAGNVFTGRDGRRWERYVTKSGKLSVRPA